MARRKNQTLTLTAASAPVDLKNAGTVKQSLAKSQSWQEEAWAYYDEVPEVKFGVNFIGNGLSKVVFFAATRTVDGAIIAVNNAESPLVSSQIAVQAEFEVSRLKSDMSGQGELNRLAAINLEIPGEFYLFGKGEIVDPNTLEVQRIETWDVISTDSVRSSNETDAEGRPVVKVKDDPDQKEPYIVDADTDTLIRAFMRHPHWKNRAESYMRALLTDCQTLVALNNQVLAESRSRMNAGLLLVPKEATFQASTKPGDANQFTTDLVDALTTPVHDPSDVRTLVPPIIRAPGDQLTADKFRRLDLSRSTDENVDNRIKDRINRVARGLNVPVEVVMGHMSTTFSNAEQIDQDTFDDHLEPKCRVLAEIYTNAFLRPQLRQANEQLPGSINVVDIDRVFVWFDPSALIHAKDPDDAAEKALDHGALSLAGYRKRRNIAETEAPSIDEQALNLALKRGSISPGLTAFLLQQAGMSIPQEFVSPDTAGATSTPAQPAMQALITALQMIAASEAPHPDPFEGTAELGRSLLDIDRDLRSRIQGAAEVAMERALERAGGRLKNRAEVKAIVASSTPSTRIAAQCGPALIASVGYDSKSLLDGAWTLLERQFKEWCISAAVEALSVIESYTTPVSAVEHDAHMLVVRGNVDAGWSWLSSELNVIGAARLYDPDGDGEIPIFGRIPTGVVREALAIAGGDQGVYNIIAAGAPTKPAGGIASGKATLDLAEGNGVVVQRYRWVYGPAHRTHPFDPHLQLNGTVFVNFNDRVLQRVTDWPRTPYYYPGDHIGCSCDVEPIVEIHPRVKEIVPKMAEAVKSGGFTINPRSGESVTSGYAIAVPNASSITNADAFFEGDNATDVVEGWLMRNAKQFDDPRTNIGGWFDTLHGEIVLDPSIVVADQAAAVELGAKFDQQAIFHLDSGSEIATGGTGQRDITAATGTV